ncbi:histamine N-methyltransferase-like isoform X1 [Heterodontus francisci]|uniref:histamine N-methyltransferase-like isoform X1 n=1 Tax=Heterodontus francisci TaxID=7792 RepID=UPI00355C86E7
MELLTFPNCKKTAMEPPKKDLSSDLSQYVKSFKLFLERSNEHECMEKFIDENLPDIVASIGTKGVSSLNVLGVGSGSGKIDFEILGKIQSKHPGLSIHNEVVEPNPEQISSYKELVKEKSQGLNISFTWNQISSEEYEKQRKERNESKKFDFIHMIEILYYVESVHHTIKYFHSLLETNGELLIIYASGNSGWHSLQKRFASQFPSNSLFPDFRKMLDEMGMKHRIYELSSDLDITECFIEGNKNGELLMDFLTETLQFMKTAPADLKAEVLQYLRQPQCSREENGKIIFNSNLQAIVVDC